MKNIVLLILAVCSITVALSQNSDNVYSLEEALSNPNNVQILFLNEVDIFPDEILLMSNLKILIIQSCNFNFPQESINLKKLEAIEISDNSSFPEGLYYLPNLKSISFSNNLFKAIEKEDAKKLKLNKLSFNNLHGNAIVPKNLYLIKVDSLEVAFFNKLDAFQKLISCSTIRYIKLSYFDVPLDLGLALETSKITTLEIEASEFRISEKMNLENLIIKNLFIECNLLNQIKHIKKVVIISSEINSECEEELKNYSNIKVKDEGIK